MTDYLIRRFIKNYDKIDDSRVRNSYGFLSGTVGIVVNLILCAIKMAIGIFSGSISIIGDAVHNLADGGASIITMFGFKLASTPADQEHPYGHGRIEYVAGLIIAGAIILIGVELLKTSIEKIITPEEVVSSPETIAILIFSVILQSWLGFFNRGLGKRINSPAMLAAAKDSHSDCVATIVVIACQILHYVMGIDLDAQAGVVVALFIMHSGWEASMDTLQPLLGEPPKPEFIRNIRRTVLQEKEILGVHDLMVHNYGPGRVFVSLHAEVPATMSLLTAHEMIDKLEERLRSVFNAVFTIHIDPMVTDDPELNSLKRDIRTIVRAIDPLMSIHDMRLTAGKKFVFEISASYNCMMTDKEIMDFIREEMAKRQPGYKLSMRIDRIS